MGFDKVRIEGGPHSVSTNLYINGQRLKGVTKFVLRGEVNDVMRLYTRQIVELEGEIEIKPENIEQEVDRD